MFKLSHQFDAIRSCLLSCTLARSFGVRWFAVARRPAPPPGPLFTESDLIEQFVRGGGSGGQSVARTANCVVLKHVPTGIVVRCHATRSRDLNRRGARKELQLRLDDIARGAGSVRGQRHARVAKKKAKAKARAKLKYGGAAKMLQALSPPLSTSTGPVAAGVARSAPPRNVSGARPFRSFRVKVSMQYFSSLRLMRFFSASKRGRPSTSSLRPRAGRLLAPTERIGR